MTDTLTIPAPAPTARKVRMFKHVCRECSQPFVNPSQEAVFCSAAHRADFNNRRRLRGAALYDLFMTQRYDRDLASQMKVWATMCKLAAHYRDEDRREREGRKSWNHPRDTLADMGFLFAQVIRRGYLSGKPRKT